MPTIPETMYVVYSLNGGGAERLLTNIILQQGHREAITVVSLLPGGTFRPTLEEAGANVTDLGMAHYGDVLRGAWRLARLMRARRPAIVHGWDYFGNLLAFLAILMCGQFSNPPRLFFAVFCTDLAAQKTKRRFRAVIRLNALLSSRVDGVVYNGFEVRDFHRRIGFREKRTVVISNSIDADVFRHDAASRTTLREKLGIAADDVVVAIVARVDPMKDWPAMCAAVRAIPGVVTIAIGDGTTSLPPQPGFIPLGWRDDIVSVLSAADIFFLGSAFGEGTSLAVGEAMLCGLPCVVTEVGDNGTLVGDAGIVVEPRNVGAMRDAIIELARDPERRRALGRIARTRAAAATSRDDGVRQLHVVSLAEASA
jgi:glycosyltransferase involved in cell wall biosynthesis